MSTATPEIPVSWLPSGAPQGVRKNKAVLVLSSEAGKIQVPSPYTALIQFPVLVMTQ